MTAPDLEGLSRRPMPEFPAVTGAVDCPCCEFSIGAQACLSRQAAYTLSNGFSRGCDPECSQFGHEAHEALAKTTKFYATPATEGTEEDCPMDASQFDRSLPEGAKVSKSGKVWRGSAEIEPCPICPTGWKSKKSKTCGACSPNHAAERTARMRQAKAAQHSPEPKIPPPKVKTSEPRAHTSKPAPTDSFPRGLVERLAQQLAAEVRVRAAEILGMKVSP